MKYAGSSLIIGLGVCAGGVVGFASADEPVVVLEPSHGRVVEAAHIYYNIGTGEQVVTRLSDGEAGPAGCLTSESLWSVLVRNPCADAGYTTEWFFALDDNAGSSSLATGATLLDYGDIAMDTVVDCVHIDWVTGHDDVDDDGDGIGDGVSGLAGRWSWWDADNGRAINGSTRLPLISFTLIDLPGNIFGDGAFTGYTADIDLANSFSSSLTFEIGDSDGDLQGAAFGNNNVDTDFDGIGDGVSVANLDRDFDGLPDSDLDGDGLFDWSWDVRFFQPGTADLDGDGFIDGDLADSMKAIGVYFAVPAGELVDNGDGTWTWEIDYSVPDAATGIEDRFTLYSPPDLNGEVSYVGGFWFNGLTCSGVPQPDGPGYTPAAMFEHQLFGPAVDPNFCDADLNGDGELNFFDVSLFLSQFQGGGDYNGDGSTNFFDVSAFLSDFNAGCP
jgi:hypothetical protein